MIEIMGGIRNWLSELCGPRYTIMEPGDHNGMVREALVVRTKWSEEHENNNQWFEFHVFHSRIKTAWIILISVVDGKLALMRWGPPANTTVWDLGDPKLFDEMEPLVVDALAEWEWSHSNYDHVWGPNGVCDWSPT